MQESRAICEIRNIIARLCLLFSNFKASGIKICCNPLTNSAYWPIGLLYMLPLVNAHTIGQTAWYWLISQKSTCGLPNGSGDNLLGVFFSFLGSPSPLRRCHFAVATSLSPLLRHCCRLALEPGWLELHVKTVYSSNISWININPFIWVQF